MYPAPCRAQLQNSQCALCAPQWCLLLARLSPQCHKATAAVACQSRFRERAAMLLITGI
jgi:hypothetical protein